MSRDELTIILKKMAAWRTVVIKGLRSEAVSAQRNLLLLQAGNGCRLSSHQICVDNKDKGDKLLRHEDVIPLHAHQG